MGSLWKAVTGFFQSKQKQDGTMTKEDVDATQNSLQREPDEDSDSDADDEDFVPNEGKEEAVSEEISDDADEDEDAHKKADGKKRKRVRKQSKFKNGKRRRVEASDVSDSEDDPDFVQDESPSSSKRKPSVEEVAAQDAEEKAETDKLWAEFLNSVESEKQKKKEKETVVEKVVDKVYDFAGEKVSVQEKVKVTVSSSGKNGDSSNPVAHSSSSTPHVFAVPGPSSAMKKMNGESSKNNSYNSNSNSNPPPPRRRGGISILGNDPETIGLDELEKRGLSGLLKAFKSKSTRIGTLEKSKLDWETYKRQQGLEDELQHHNKSRDTYIDKQEFLQRTDYRQFEHEKSMRATARSKRLAN